MSSVATQPGGGQVVNKPHGMIGSAIAFVLELFLWLVLALFFNILVELVGIFLSTGRFQVPLILLK